jgi:hypothetical protein
MAGFGAGAGSGYTGSAAQRAAGAKGLFKPEEALGLPAGPMAPMADMGGGGGISAAPVAMPELAEEAPNSAPPSLQGLQGLGGNNASPPGEIIAPGSMRQGIGRRVPPSLAALLKPRVY